MSNVWLTIPSARPPAEANLCLKAWKSQGYMTAVFRDNGAGPVEADLIVTGKYFGYSTAVNHLSKMVFEADALCDWIVAAGDDTTPDLNHDPRDIAESCSHHFSGTFGVMQPTGDRWADSRGVIIERIAGSPWIGRDFARRMYGGEGPYWPGYTHCFLDEELWYVAKTLSCYWEREDLIHYHAHWSRCEGAQRSDCPPHLQNAISQAHWQHYQAIFNERRSQGFPGYEPIR